MMTVTSYDGRRLRFSRPPNKFKDNTTFPHLRTAAIKGKTQHFITGEAIVQYLEYSQTYTTTETKLNNCLLRNIHTFQ